MARKLVTFDTRNLSRADRRVLREIERERIGASLPTPAEVETPPWQGRVDRMRTHALPTLAPPRHVGTGWEFAAANPFAAADLYDVVGPVIGVEKLSGSRAFVFHPWNMYLAEIIASPNLLVKGNLRRGKSFIIKRLVTLLALYGVKSINTSDVKGEHGVVAEAIGGHVFRMGGFGSNVRVNPLEAGERHAGETPEEHTQRMLASRQKVLFLIAELLVDGDEPLKAFEQAILTWALDEVIRDTNDRPTIRLLLGKIDSAELECARGGRFERHMADRLLFLFDRLLHGNLAGMFEDEGSVSLDPDSPYTVFDTFAMEKRGDLALAITQTVTNTWVQNVASNKGERRVMVIREEGWRDMKTKAALEAHELQLKLSGEYGITMVMIVHEDGDFDTGGEEERQLAQKLLRGYANTITFHQSEGTLRRSVASGTLTAGEAQLVGGFGRGMFLFRAGSRSYVVDGRPTSTQWEKEIFDTDRAMRQMGREVGAK